MPNFVALGHGGIESRTPLIFDMSLAELDHFEVRPFGGRHRFFFEAVTLPKASANPFASPPVVQVKIDGQERDVTVPEFAPINVQLVTRRGDWMLGNLGGRIRPTVLRRQMHNSPQVFTLENMMRGVTVPVVVKYRLSKSALFVPGSSLGFRRVQSFAASASSRVEFACFDTPLDDLETVEVTLSP